MIVLCYNFSTKFFRRYSYMLSDDIFVNAVVKFKDNPSYLALLQEIWPAIRKHDFSKEPTLKIPKPKHEINYCGSMVETPYSHKIIERALNSIGMTSTHHKDIEFIHVKESTCATKKVSQKKNTK